MAAPGSGIVSRDDVLELMDASIPAAALQAALRLGLFWMLLPRPVAIGEIAASLAIPPGRCLRWLELLGGLGLLERRGDTWSPSAVTRSAIVGAHSRDTWAMLAQEAAERHARVADLATALRAGLDCERAASYVDLMAADPDRARRFSRMLLELHQPLAGRLASVLDLTGVHRVLDLGGGSGVVAIALAAQNPAVRITILDVATVCDAAREIVEERGLSDRIAFLPGDFLADELPSGFDLVLECDVGVYETALFARVRALVPGNGRFVIVDQFEAVGGDDLSHQARTLERSLRDPDFAPPSATDVRSMLREAGFATIVETPLPALPGIGGLTADRLTVIEARPGAGAE